MDEIPEVINPLQSNVITIHGGTSVSLHAQRRLRAMPRCNARDFEVVKLLGAGDVGRVYLVRKAKELLLPSAPKQQLFALKVMSVADLKRRNKLRRFHSEYDILLSSQHPFIMHLHAAFADQRNYYLLMELCEMGELAQIMRLQPDRHFTERQALQFASEVLSALEYLHYHGIVYRDLKTENVLLHSDGHLRLTDFDLAKRLLSERVFDMKSQTAGKGFAQSGSPTSDSSRLFNTSIRETSLSFVGTAEYLAPEVLQGAHSQAADFWTLGIFIYELLYGVTPFYVSQGGFAAISRRIQSGLYTFPFSPKVSEWAKDLIKKLLVTDPKQRLGYQTGCSEIKKHPWFKHVNFAVVYPPTLDLAQLKAQLQATQKPFNREPEQIAKEFAGTQFKLPDKAQSLVPQALKLIEQSGLPTNPKPVDILDEQGELLVQEQQKQGAAATYAGKKAEPKRAGLQDLFGGFKQSAKQQPAAETKTPRPEAQPQQQGTPAPAAGLEVRLPFPSAAVQNPPRVVNEDSV